MAHEVVDVVQQGLRLGEVTVAKSIDVEVGDRYRVEPGDHGVGDVYFTRPLVKHLRIAES